MTTKTNAVEESFDAYSARFYREHVRRASSSRKQARSVKVTYPLFGLLLFGVPFFGIIFGLNFAYERNVVRLIETVPFETYQMFLPFLYAAAGSAVLFGMIVGFMLGLSKSRNLLFDAEGLELKMRTDYHAFLTATELGDLTSSLAPVPAAVSAKRGATRAQEDLDEDPLAHLMLQHGDLDEHEFER